jgi:hypothetical protein
MIRPRKIADSLPRLPAHLRAVEADAGRGEGAAPAPAAPAPAARWIRVDLSCPAALAGRLRGDREFAAFFRLAFAALAQRGLLPAGDDLLREIAGVPAARWPAVRHRLERLRLLAVNSDSARIAPIDAALDDAAAASRCGRAAVRARRDR